ncbi:MAG: hypothetical protein V1816_06365 [Pseudomonadota bacterium]
MFSISSLAQNQTAATMIGSTLGNRDAGDGTQLSLGELKAKAVEKTAEMNIIQPKTYNNQNKNRNKLGLNLQSYNSLGKLGEINAVKRAGTQINDAV